MKKPNYKRALKGLMDILDTIPEPKESTHKAEIKDVTNKHLGKSYQFSEHEMTFFKGHSKNKKLIRKQKIKRI